MRHFALAVTLLTAATAGAQNLITNGTFDRDLSGWNINDVTARWDAADATQSGTSGSARVYPPNPLGPCVGQVTSYESTDASFEKRLPRGLYQTFAVMPGVSYTINAMMRRNSDGDGSRYAHVWVCWTDADNHRTFCQPTLGIYYATKDDTWGQQGAIIPYPLTAPPFAATATIALHACTEWFDPISFNFDDIILLPRSTLKANFLWSPTAPISGQILQFTDTSTGTPTSWSWEFGDGSTSTVRSPTHTYASAGAYNAKLTVMNASGNSSATKQITVTADENAEDTDGDGLPNAWERNGVTLDGVFVNLPAMGANPLRKDLFVEVDYMDLSTGPESHTHQPKPEAIAIVIETFWKAPLSNPDGSTGVSIHIDCGSECIMNPTSVERRDGEIKIEGSRWGAHSRADVLAHQQKMGVIGFDDFYALRAKHFGSARRPVFHYSIFGHQLGGIGGLLTPDTSGYAPSIGGPDFIVTLGSWSDGVGTVTEQAGTFLHELGHTLGLHHGGDEHVQYKPNYLSVMNYLYQTTGIIRDREPTFDYSREALPELDEEALDERVGLRLADAGITTKYGTAYWIDFGDKRLIWPTDSATTVDWNNDQRIEARVTADINDGIARTLRGHKDWSRINFRNKGIGTKARVGVLEAEQIDELTPEIAQQIVPYRHVRIRADGDRALAPGSATTSIIRIQNTGQPTETLRIAISSQRGWSDTLPRTVTLAPGTATTITVHIRVPQGTPEGTQDAIHISATSTTSATVTDSATLRVTTSTPGRRRAVNR